MNSRSNPEVMSRSSSRQVVCAWSSLHIYCIPNAMILDGQVGGKPVQSRRSMIRAWLVALRFRVVFRWNCSTLSCKLMHSVITIHCHLEIGKSMEINLSSDSNGTKSSRNARHVLRPRLGQGALRPFARRRNATRRDASRVKEA